MSKQHETPTPGQIRGWRTDAGLTQVQAAEAAMVSRRTWINWEDGTYTCPPATWQLLQIKSKAIRVPALPGAS